MRDNLDELRHIDGFPLGEDEDLHALSDPPYYTAYPNPHIGEFIQKYGKPYDEATDNYHREPYVADVSEGKSDPIYNAHSYHTKVPYKAIIPFIEHYSNPGDLVFDGFCGTGMTGVAAQAVGRRAILCDLSPAATFIAQNYNRPIDPKAFEREVRCILDDLETECGWMYQTYHVDGKVGRINYTVWSDVFLCPYCTNEIIFWDVAVEDGEVSDRFLCPKCKAQLTKRALKRSTEVIIDVASGETINKARQVPVLINYTVGQKRYEKKPDEYDIGVIGKINQSEIPYWYPTNRIDRDIDIWYERDYRSLGIFAIHHFYTKRNLWMTAYLWDRVRKVDDIRLRHHLFFWIQSVTVGFSKLNRYLKNAFSQVNRILSGTLYVGSTTSEVSPWYALNGKISKIANAASLSKKAYSIITTCSTTGINLLENSIDYIFVDPPFGSNIIYSDLSIIWESWLRVSTDTAQEAVVHRRKKSGNTLDDYRLMMTESFGEMYKALKPGRWITVEFHNSRASVWNAIQEALARAGFLVAQVTVLDKQTGSFKQVTSPGAVKNDLIINAYKPQSGFTNQFVLHAGRGLEASFLRELLNQLPKSANVERSKEMLYSKYLAYYVQHGYQIAYNGEQFYRVLPQWGFVERDGYWFANEAQANEYEKRKLKTTSKGQKGVPQGQQVLFISDEKSARQWLWAFLNEPKSYDEIYTAFVKSLQTPEDQIPELKVMLEEGFVRSNGEWKRPDALTQAELEKRRQQRLLNQFEEYLRSARAGQRLKEVRKEALVAGFTEAYRESRFADILAVGRKLNKRLLEESPDLFDFVDIAEAKMGG